jgi:Fe-S-cluster containining protein
LSFSYPTDVIFRCARCGQCCGDTKQKVRHILLLRSDAQKIVEQTKRSVSDFSKEVEGKSPYVYEMLKDSKTGKCIFLENSQCTIYDFRPLICRFYPFELKTDSTRTPCFKATMECPSISFQSTPGENKVPEKHFKILLDLAQKELAENNV